MGRTRPPRKRTAPENETTEREQICDYNFLNRISELNGNVQDARNQSELIELNSELGSVKTEIEDTIMSEAETSTCTTSTLAKLKKDRVIFYLECYMLISRTSLLCSKRLGDMENQEEVERPGEAHVVVDRLKTENMDLKSELLTDKRTIIELQQQLVVKSNTSMENVEMTVKRELQSYSAIVKSSCSEALAPRKIESAVRKATVSTDEREKNLVVFGLEEKDDEDCDHEVGLVLDVVGEKPYITTCSRIGNRKPGVIRPVKVILRSSANVLQVLKKSSKLKESEDFKSVYLSRDYSREDRLARKKLVDEFKRRISDEPSKSFKIDFRKKIITETDTN